MADTSVISAVSVIPMTSDHADRVLAIYQAGIDGGDATFQTAAPSWSEFDASKLPGHRFVAVGDGGEVLGWIVVSATSQRECYRGVVENSVYVDPAAHGRGVGSALLRALIDSTEAAGIWTIQSGIFPENIGSLVLHARHGFRTVGHQEKVGRGQNGVWRDVTLVERRSGTVF